MIKGSVFRNYFVTRSIGTYVFIYTFKEKQVGIDRKIPAWSPKKGMFPISLNKILFRIHYNL